MRFPLLSRLAALAAVLALPAALMACPFCPSPSLTLTEQVSKSDAAVLVEWVSADKGRTEGGEDASTVYKIRDVIKGPYKAGQTIKQVGYQPAKAGDLFLMTGVGGGLIEWDLPVEFSAAAYRYLADAPPVETPDGTKVPTTERLPYFAKFLEFTDDTIANDAFGEFANAPYEDIVAAKSAFSNERVRGWILSDATPSGRRGLYGLLLGLSGDERDAEVLKSIITQPSQDLRIGLDGIISGYLLLTGKPGLELVEQLKLKNEFLVDAKGQPLKDKDGQAIQVPFSETYAALQAVRFLWNYAPDRIPADRLKQSMEILLDRPELADLAIADLARWKDWSIESKLYSLYGKEGYDAPAVQRAIIRYFMAAEKDVAPDAKQVPAHVTAAKEYLAKIEKQDPQTVAQVKQFLILVP